MSSHYKCALIAWPAAVRCCHRARYVTLEADTAPQRLRMEAAIITTTGLPTASTIAPMNADTTNCATNTMLLTCKTATHNIPHAVQVYNNPSNSHSMQTFTRSHTHIHSSYQLRHCCSNCQRCFFEGGVAWAGVISEKNRAVKNRKPHSLIRARRHNYESVLSSFRKETNQRAVECRPKGRCIAGISVSKGIGPKYWLIVSGVQKYLFTTN